MTSARAIDTTINEESLARVTISNPPKLCHLRGTIRDNMKIGKLDATDEELWIAADAAQIGDYIRKLPKGLSHSLSDGGVSLSSGQKQRIALTRAILRHPSILILDEATSHLDVSTEARVLKALRASRSSLITIVITHRQLPAQPGDRKFVLSDGHLQETEPFRSDTVISSELAAMQS